MSSQQSMSKQLQQLIKSIGETKSKQEEDRIILNQLSTLKSRINQKNISARKLKEHLIRALYIQMLGHSASFCHIQAINLTQNKNLILKRIGYLLCSLFLNKNSDLVIMLVSTIQKDLNSSNVHEVVMCLTSLDLIMNATIAGAITDSIVKLIGHQTDLIRKKAILVLQKIQLVTGNSVPDYKDKIKKALCDRQPSVMSVALNLYLDQVKQNPRKYRDLTASFVIILKQVVEHKLPKQFDYHRLPAPWVQMKLLKLLQVLGKGDKKSSEHCYTILEQTLHRSEDGSNNIAFAVCYQTVKTISNIYPNENLILEAASSLKRFLQSQNSNIKYMGIRGLSHIYKQYPQLLQDYQMVIVDCLESKDETLKRQTLQLLYKMTNNKNIEVIVSKMLNTLHSSTDAHFRNTLVLKITALAQRFASGHQWYVDTMCLLFELGSEYLTDEILNNFLKLVVENCEQDSDFSEYILQKMTELINKVVPTDFILKVVSWILGQIGSTYITSDPNKISDLCLILLRCLEHDSQNHNTKVWVFDAIIKLSSTKDFQLHDKVKVIINNFNNNQQIELYQRSIQSKRLAKYNAALRAHHNINFDEDLSFLQGFVEDARKNGAKEYKKMELTNINDLQQLRFTPYEPKKIQSSFPFGNQEKKEEPEIKTKIQYEPKTQNPTLTEPTKQKPKKTFISPQQKAKKNLANNLFGGVTKPKGPANLKGPTKTTQPQKKVQTADLL